MCVSPIGLDFIGDKHVELGAQWIHGEEGNAAFEIADSIGLTRKLPAQDKPRSPGSPERNTAFAETEFENLTNWTGEASLRDEIAELSEEWKNVAFVTNEGELVPRRESNMMAVLTATLQAEEFWETERFDGMNDGETEGKL